LPVKTKEFVVILGRFRRKIYLLRLVRYIYINTLAAIVLKIFEPNVNMFFLGLIARLSSLMSKIGKRGGRGRGLKFGRKDYVSQPLWSLEGSFVCIIYSIPFEVYGDTNDSVVVGVRVWVGVEILIF